MAIGGQARLRSAFTPPAFHVALSGSAFFFRPFSLRPWLASSGSSLALASLRSPSSRSGPLRLSFLPDCAGLPWQRPLPCAVPSSSAFLPGFPPTSSPRVPHVVRSSLAFFLLVLICPTPFQRLLSGPDIRSGVAPLPPQSRRTDAERVGLRMALLKRPSLWPSRQSPIVGVPPLAQGVAEEVFHRSPSRAGQTDHEAANV